ncbi:hypothetical protein CBL_05989 [Carabus blaptoides fortunei]
MEEIVDHIISAHFSLNGHPDLHDHNCGLFACLSKRVAAQSWIDSGGTLQIPLSDLLYGSRSNPGPGSDKICKITGCLFFNHNDKYDALLSALYTVERRSSGRDNMFAPVRERY